MNAPKNVLAIHDISCFGKCSITTALPIISACGVTCTVLPTAVLSTHTGGFTNYTVRDLADDLIPIVNHWKTLNIKFDAIYTGYLASESQVAMIEEIIKMFKTDNTKVIVDPVMADNGKLYPGFDKKFAKRMGELTKSADIIVPNFTEASYILNTEYNPNPTKEEVKAMVKALKEYSGADVLVTGVKDGDDKLGGAVLEKNMPEIQYAYGKKIEGSYHGTGDIFASAVTASLMRGHSLIEATKFACDFTSKAVELTKDEIEDSRFGVDFENALPVLLKSLKIV